MVPSAHVTSDGWYAVIVGESDELLLRVYEQEPVYDRTWTTAFCGPTLEAVMTGAAYAAAQMVKMANLILGKECHIELIR
jgi:hypothetical protein